MSAVPKPPQKVTFDEYLAIERRAEVKSEYYRGEMFAMAGASPQHNTAKENMIGEVFGRLKGGPCRSYSSDQRVRVGRTGLYTYPDMVVVCGRPEFASEDPHTLVNPQIIFEFLSESTETYDRGRKFQHYQQMPSLREYVLVSVSEMRIERYVRQSDDSWLLTIFADPAGEFSLTTVPVRIPLRDVYMGVEFPPVESEPARG